jgi:hypothetical protein
VSNSDASYEITGDTLKLAKKKANVKRLRKLAQHFCDAIFKSSDIVPGYVDYMTNEITFHSKIRLLCALVKREVGVAFPNLEFSALAVLLFLRFICPAICSPKSLFLVESMNNMLLIYLYI